MLANPLPAGPFRLLLVDPPWAFRTHSGADRTPTQKRFQEAEDHYSTMSVDDMAVLPVADMMDRHALMAMWVVGSHLDAAIDLGRAWGFEFVTDLFYWAKQRLVHADQIDLFTGDIPAPPFSMGYHTRKQVEPCLLFKRGRGLPVLDHGVPQLILAPRGEHSRKPVEQYDRLQRLYGDVPRIEMFSRSSAPGWTAWGNEVGKYDREAACA